MPNVDVDAVNAVVAADILREAATIVAGSRNATHGSKRENFSTIAEFWNVYLRAVSRKQSDIGEAPIIHLSPADVALLMVLMKIARCVNGTPIQDHYLDAAGYAAIAGELELS